MTTITKLTKEQLIEEVKRKIAVAERHPDSDVARIEAEIFKIALASMEAKPVAWECGENIILFNPDTVEAYAKRAEISPKPLYTAPPALAGNEFTPKNLDKALGVVGVALPESKEEFNFQIERWIQRLIDRVIRYADEFKEQPVPVVPEEMPKGLAGQIVSLLAHNIGDKFLAQKIWNACRDAMLNAEPLHATPKGNRLRIAEGKLAEYSLSKREPQPTPESADRKMLKRLAVIMSGSDSGGEISALTVTAQSLVDRCKALALDKEKLAATESLVFEVKCPFPYGWGELKRRTNQDALFFSAYMVEGEEITELHRDIVSRTVDRLLKVIAVCQTDASFNGPTTWNPASLEEVNKRILRESTGIPSREAIIAGGVLVQCPRCYNDSYRLNVNGLTHYWCDKCANSITSESK